MIKELIKKLPDYIHTPIKYAYGIIPIEHRLGTKFIETYEFLSKSQYWTKEQHEQYQIKQLRKLLTHAYNNVPYYHNLFNECGFNVRNFKYLEDMCKLPVLTKDIAMKNMESMKAQNFKKRDFIYASTGGTTGKQMKFFIQKKFSQAREWAFVSNQWNRVGYQYNKTKRIILRNQVLPKDKLWMWDYAQNSLIVDTYHLIDENIKKIIDKFNEEKIEYIHTYPSVITILCDFIRRTGYGLSYNLKAVLATSENIYKGQREYIEETLNTRLFSFYGHSELCIFAGECEKSNKYHIFSEYGYVELLDKNQNLITENGIQGELVGTSFNNYAMPFIRYKTGDYASYSENQDCECGRNYKLIDSVEGRWLQEMIITSKGNKIPITAINMHSNIFDNVSNFQFYQDEAGICIINIVKRENYSEKDERVIIKELSNKLSNDVVLKVKYVDKIERTVGGKYKFLIQKINA